MQNVALHHSQPANMFFLIASQSQKGKANPNPRAISATQFAQPNAGIKMQSLKCR
jgi:hypothetical protein